MISLLTTRIPPEDFVDLNADGMPPIPAYIHAFMASPVECQIEKPNIMKTNTKIHFISAHTFRLPKVDISSSAAFKLQSWHKGLPS